MKIKKGEAADLSITDLAFGGRGIAKVDGYTVFVDQTAPGDHVEARIYKKKKNYAEARVLRMIEPSDLRIEPPCPYSGLCGGCRWQFLPYEYQLSVKRRQVEDALMHIAGISDVTVLPVKPSPNVYGYRNKMEFSVSDRRWLLPDELGKEGVDRGFALGLHVPGTFFKVLDIDACLLQPESGNHILDAVRDKMIQSGKPAYGLKSHQGFWRFLMLRHSAAYDRWMINIISSGKDENLLPRMGRQLMDQFPGVVSVVNNVTARKSSVAVGEREFLLAGEPVLRDKILGYEFEISANSFFQTNTLGAEVLYDTVREFAGLTGTETVLDLYCGTGTISICLAEQAKNVTGMEQAPSAVLDAVKNCERNQVDNCRFIEGDVRQKLKEFRERPDLVVIDPPRDGMHKDVVKQIMAMKPPGIVYVSCNPSTLARDAALLKEVYRIEKIQPVDMFPHTFHIEAVAALTLKQHPE